MQVDAIVSTTWLFVTLSLITGCVYIFNDLCDRRLDEKHPQNRLRPIASGKITPREALIFLILVMGMSGMSLFLRFSEPGVFLLILAYLIMNIAYSTFLKPYLLAGVTIVALGFVIRIHLGGLVGNVDISEWIVVMTFLLALFLAMAKRRDSIAVLLNDENSPDHMVLKKKLEFCNTTLYTCAGIVIIAYIMYTLDPVTKQRFGNHVYLTSLFIVLGVFRYLQLIFIENKAGNPTETLLKDRWLLLIVLTWLGTFCFFAYGHPILDSCVIFRPA